MFKRDKCKLEHNIFNFVPILWCEAIISLGNSTSRISFVPFPKTNVQVYLDKPLVRKEKGCAFVGTIYNIKRQPLSNNTTTTTLNVCVPGSPTTIFVQFSDLVYVILAVGVVRKSCRNPNILKSWFKAIYKVLWQEETYKESTILTQHTSKLMGSMASWTKRREHFVLEEAKL